MSNYSVPGRFRHLLLSIASGLILALALPRPGTWIAAWVGLVPLLIALRGAGPWRASLCGFAAGLVYYGIILHWITLFGYLPWALLVIYEALYIAVFAVLCVRLQPSRIGWPGYIAAPAAWVLLQFLQTLGPYAFTWGGFAHTQADNLPIAQIASVTGPWGIDFLVCLFNLALAEAISRRSRRFLPLVAAGCLTIAVCAFGFTALRSSPESASGRSIAIVQGGLKNGFDVDPGYTDRALRTYVTLTSRAAESRPDLIIWPETALPADLTSPGWERLLGTLARIARADLLVGGYSTSDDPFSSRVYNSLFLYNAAGQKAGVYRKVRLVPFGEFVPMRDRLPFLANYGIRPDDVLAARKHVLLSSRLGKLGVSICFESIFPQIARSETRAGARMLCVVTNDAWFERTQAAGEHLMMAKLRAIENRRYVLRAAETGISAVIDPFGRTRRRLGLFRQGIISDKVRPSACLTIYTRWGDWFAYGCVAATLLGLTLSMRWSRGLSREKRRRET